MVIRPAVRGASLVHAEISSLAQLHIPIFVDVHIYLSMLLRVVVCGHAP